MSTNKWYKTVRRWGQTNLTEIDPEICDIGWWKEFWKKTDTQGIIVNAGGIVAYYPTGFELQYKAEKLGNHDFFGEFVKAGRDMGIAILARMDINRTTVDFYNAHPQWFAMNKNGEPYVTQGRYYSCVNSDYYKKYIPEVLKEIINGYHPDGFTDNSWTGLPRKLICYCDNCKKSFFDYCGETLPEKADFDDSIYRKWIKWSYKCRMDNWDLYNEVTKKFGGEDCLWLGMVNANFVSGHASFCDLREVGKRSDIIMVDHQSRDDINGFEQNSLNGWLLHQLMGWDKIAPESMANYVRGIQSYRRSANPDLELKLWMAEGMAGGISPWWHFVGAVQEDARMYEMCVPMMQWHQRNEQYLYNRAPVANVGIVWSQDNVDFYGRDKSKDRVELAWRGITMALTRAGVPFTPINANDIDGDTKNLDLLILPELAVMSDSQCEAVKRFGSSGKNVLITGNTCIMDETGEYRLEFGMSELAGIDYLNMKIDEEIPSQDWENPVLHNYLRINDKASPLFSGFERTAILPMGGICKKIKAHDGTKVLATYIPQFPIYPPEFSWMRVTKTDVPVITACEGKTGGKTVYFSWDVDCAYGRAALPDHGDLLGNAVKWLLKGKTGVCVECDAYIDFKVYRQQNRLLIHLINSNNTGFAHGYAEKTLPVGPVKITFKLDDFTPVSVAATENDGKAVLTSEGNSDVITLDKIGMQQLIIVSGRLEGNYV